MKLKQFNLEKAQAGHPWGTRDGRKGKKIFDTEREGADRLIAIIEDESMPWCCIDGSYYEDRDESENDLFLYEEEKIGWVVMTKDESCGFIPIRFIDEIAKNNYEEITKANGTYHSTVEVRY